MRIALAQIDPTVGDLRRNTALIIDWTGRARDAGADVVAFPELAVSGYPPEDLLLKDHFVGECRRALDEIAAECEGIVALVGVPLMEGSAVYNGATVIAGGEVVASYRKIRLPNYAVFDEKRYFTPGERVVVLETPGGRLGLNICEDVWEDCGPTELARLQGGAQIVVNLSMSPYHLDKGREREQMLSRRSREAGVYLCYLNGVGGQDELVFDGQSLVLDPWGRVVARASQFVEELLVVDIELPADGPGPEVTCAPDLWPVETIDVDLPPRERGGARQDAGSRIQAVVRAPLDMEAEVYEALCLGVRDYVRKNGFEEVVMGVSGGIDSALTVCIAADALGRSKVNAVSMPSRYSSAGTKNDAREVAERLGVTYHEIPIEPIYRSYLASLESRFEGTQVGVTEQNIQARIRGNLLMALSNKFGWLVLTTGNKSEMAVGYATLYGDMAGGFAALKDVPKTLVYRLSEYRNSVGSDGGPIPESTIVRAPSAELAEDQTDQDTLPPYDVLDKIIDAYVVRDESVEEMMALGIDRGLIERVVAMVDGNEYKRRQAAPGVRITPKAFGKDRRLPITNRYRG